MPISSTPSLVRFQPRPEGPGLSLPPLFLLLRVMLGSLFFLAGPATASITVTDMAGRVVTLPADVHRVYAVGHCLPIVGAVAPDKLLNAPHLVGDAARYLSPAFYADKTPPGNGLRYSDEEVARLSPDLIVMETAAGAEDQASRMEARLHVPVLLIDQDMLKFRQAFAFLGKVLGRPAQARALSDFVTTYLDPIREHAHRIPEADRVRVYYAEGPNGLATNPAGSSHSQVLDFIGARNVAQVAGQVGEGTSAVSLEQLYLWQPEWILVWTPGADKLTTWHAIVDDPLWQPLGAVRHGHVLQIPWLPFSWFDRPPGSNRILGALWLAKLFYPDNARYDLIAATRTYFHLFYHVDLSPDEARALLDLARPGIRAGHPG